MTLQEALSTYLNRQSRLEHPSGSFDKAGRWYPSESEQRDCCRHIRYPSRAWPLSLNKHCRSVEHIAALCGVDVRELRRAVRAARTA